VFKPVTTIKYRWVQEAKTGPIFKFYNYVEKTAYSLSNVV